MPGTLACIARRLAQCYARYTFDDPVFAELPIDTGVRGLVAGALSSLSASQQLMVSLMRKNNLRTNRANSQVLAATSEVENKITVLPLDRPYEADTAMPLAVKFLAPVPIALTEAAA